MSIKASELILNPDGSVYHLNLLPEHIADNVIFVGDQDRVERITSHFESIEFSIQKGNLKHKLVIIKENVSRLFQQELDQII